VWLRRGRRRVHRKEPLASQLHEYDLFWAVSAELQHQLGRAAKATAAEHRALALTSNPAEQSLLLRRLRDRRC
jgi:RNA polymerase sigma-70 factor (ECF subfamily)